MTESTDKGFDIVSRRPALAVGICLLAVLLAGLDYVEFIPSLSFVTGSRTYVVFHEIHDLLAVALAVFVVSRWSLTLGTGVTFLFLLVHLPLAFIVPGEAFLMEMARPLVLAAIGVATIGYMRKQKRAERLFSSLAQDAPTGIYIAQDGKFRYVNLRFQQYAGLSERELLGRRTLELVAPEDRAHVQERAVKMLKGTDSADYEFRMLTADGAPRWVLETVTSAEYRGRRATLGNIVDISERKVAEEALRISEARYRSLVEELPDGIYQAALDGTYIMLNQAGARILGFDSPAGVIGKRRTSDFVSDAVNREIARNVRRTGIWSGELQAKNRDGVVIWLRGNIAGTRDQKGIIVGYEGVFTDITARKRTEVEAGEHAMRMESLHQVSQALAGSLELGPLAELALREALQAVGLDAGVIRHLDNARQELAIIASQGLPPEVDRELRLMVGRLKMGEGMAGTAAQTGSPLIVKDLDGDSRLRYPDLARLEFNFAVYLPLKAKDRVVGVISGYSKRKNSLSHSDMEVLASLGSMVGVAMANARLFEQVVHASQEWRQTFDSMSEGVAVMSLDQTIIRANHTLAKLVGSTPKELVGRRCFEVIHGLEEPVEDCPFARCVAQAQVCRLDRQEPHLANRWLQMGIDPVVGVQGDVIGAIHTFTDISQLKLQEHRLEQLHQLSRTLSSSLDLDTVLGQATDSVSRSFGGAGDTVGIALLDEWRQKFTFAAVRGPREAELKGVSVPVARLNQDAKVRLFDERRPLVRDSMTSASQAVQDLPGFKEYGSLVAVPLVMGDRTIGALIVAGNRMASPDEVNVLETWSREIGLAVGNAQLYARTDAALGRQIAELEALLSSMGEGLVVVDREGRTIHFNRAAEALFATPASHAIGLPIEEFRDGFSRAVVDREAFLADWDAALTRLKELPTMNFQLDQGQSRVHVQTLFFPVQGVAGELGYGVLFRDVTKEREVDRMKSEFISIASHELRTPMTSVYGFAELLLLRSENLTDRQRDWIGTIHRESKRLTDILEDLLNVSRIESGHLSLDLKPVAIEPILAGIVAKLVPVYSKHHFTVSVPEATPQVKADTDKLTQVFTNLIDNAAKYSLAGGPIEVKASFDRSSSSVLVSVSDQGVGIPAEALPKLFTRFHRVRQPETAGIRGTGLGLYIVKLLVDLMKGRVWVDSDLGKGSTFYVLLPVELN